MKRPNVVLKKDWTTFEVAHRYLCSDSSWDGGEEIKMKETNGVAATTKEKTAATP